MHDTSTLLSYVNSIHNLGDIFQFTNKFTLRKKYFRNPKIHAVQCFHNTALALWAKMYGLKTSDKRVCFALISLNNIQTMKLAIQVGYSLDFGPSSSNKAFRESHYSLYFWIKSQNK